jgi:L-fuculose-phosphate aldolase
MPAWNALRRELTAACGRLFAEGFVPGTSGNVSVRCGEEGFLITPSGLSLGELDPADVVHVGLDGRAIAQRKPSSEVDIHRMIYRERPDVGAIAHAHCWGCMAFAMARVDFGPPANLEIYTQVGVPVVIPFAPPGEWGEVLAPRLEEADCFLLANHGVVTLGPTLRAAAHRIEEVENFARSLLAARRLGGEKAFSPDELERIHAFLERNDLPLPRRGSPGG